MWHYGHATQIERRMIVLQERSLTFGEGVRPTAEMVARGRERLRELYGMPMGLEPVLRLAATIEACRAFVGARMHARERALALLRSLRRRAHSDQQRLDDPKTIAGAARDAGLEPELVASWCEDDEVEAALRADMAATRDPLPEALALPHRLARSDRGLRYSTSSGVFEHEGRRLVAAGFQSFAVYEIAIANVAPHVERRPAPATVEEVLAWAPFALATAEVAELRGIDLQSAREELEHAGASFTPSANDGYWHA